MRCVDLEVINRHWLLVPSSDGGCPIVPTVPRAGNHPHVAKLTRKSPVRPSVTSIPSASSASRWRCAPVVPGPREEIVPAAETTLCHGTGGVTSGDRNFKAVSAWSTSEGEIVWRRTLADVSRMSRHANQLGNVACICIGGKFRMSHGLHIL
jgi:hypothetical protein